MFFEVGLKTYFFGGVMRVAMMVLAMILAVTSISFAAENNVLVPSDTVRMVEGNSTIYYISTASRYTSIRSAVGITATENLEKRFVADSLGWSDVFAQETVYSETSDANGRLITTATLRVAIKKK